MFHSVDRIKAQNYIKGGTPHIKICSVSYLESKTEIGMAKA